MARNNNLHDFLTDIANAIRGITSGGSSSSDILYYKVVKDESETFLEVPAWQFAFGFMYLSGYVTHLIEVKTPASSLSGSFSYTGSQNLNRSMPLNSTFSPTLSEESLNVLGFAIYKGKTTNAIGSDSYYTSSEGTLAEKLEEYIKTLREDYTDEAIEACLEVINKCFIPISKEEYAALA